MGVLDFAIGFGKKIVKKRIGDTTYSVGLIPLGGYVRMVGDDPALLNETADANLNPSDLLEGKTEEPLDERDRALLADKTKWFLLKGYWSKSAIVVAGPLFNILFALVLSFALHLVYGKPDPESFGTKPVIGSVAPGFPAEKSGLRAKDKVLSINGKPIATWNELATTIATSEGKPLALSIERPVKGEKPESLTLNVSGTFETGDLTALDPVEKKEHKAMIGITPDFERVPVTALEALTIAPKHIWLVSQMTVRGLYAMVSGAISPKSIAGPIFILGEAARSAEQGMDVLWNFMILLSVSLAIFNLLPIPVLDGGHLLFFTLGAIRGEPLSMKLQRIASQVGMCLLLLLMVFAFSNDLIRHFAG